MRYLIHDYAGHPFQVQLSRHLARRGHDVTHLYCADNSGPKGSFERRHDDPKSLRFMGVSVTKPTENAAGTGAQARFWVRFCEMAYGWKVAQLIKELRPHAVISGNTPTEAQQPIITRCRRENIRFVYWLQDIYSLAVTRYMGRKLGILGQALGCVYQRWDRRQFANSDAIVAISEDFVPVVKSWANTKVAVIENWAAIEDLPLGPKNNAWSRIHGLHNRFAFLYSGTLGRKHNPELMVKLAQRCTDGDIVVIAGQGHGLAQLHKMQASDPIEALRLLPIQPANQLANVLTSADVLVATMEPDAGAFAVPSKVLSYLCTGRPILLAAPKTNLAARIIDRANAGITVDPHDTDGFLDGAKQLREDAGLRATLGANGRAYAESTFDMKRITDQFESVLNG